MKGARRLEAELRGCPLCGAEPGFQCMTSSDRPCPVPHAARVGRDRRYGVPSIYHLKHENARLREALDRAQKMLVATLQERESLRVQIAKLEERDAVRRNILHSRGVPGFEADGRP